MKKIMTILILAFVAISCDRKFDDPDYTGGSADLTRFVAVGNSLTAGFADGTLYISGQENSTPAIMANQFKLVGGASEFKQPLMADENGGLPFPGFNVKLVMGYSTNCQGVTGIGPVLATTSPPNNANGLPIGSQGPFHNIGVPGAKVSHLLAAGYGNAVNLPTGQANPYFVRFASTSNATMVEDAMLSNPTFFSLWIGNNDILGYATSGGNDTLEPPTAPIVFAGAYEIVANQLTAGGAKGVVANIPDVTSIPFFTTVPYNAADLDQATATSLNQLFSFIADSLNTVVPGLGEQYRFIFNAGPNAMLVSQPISTTNPLGLRQLKSNELILLSVDQDAMRCEGYGLFNEKKFDPTDPASALLAISPLRDEDVLTTDELDIISSHTSAYNETILSVANAKGLAYADIRSTLAEGRATGFTFDGVDYSTTYGTGGTFSLDGVHLTPRGYAIAANVFIDAINAKYGTKVPNTTVNNYNGVIMP